MEELQGPGLCAPEISVPLRRRAGGSSSVRVHVRACATLLLFRTFLCMCVPVTQGRKSFKCTKPHVGHRQNSQHSASLRLIALPCE